MTNKIVEIDSAVSTVGQGKYMIYVSFFGLSLRERCKFLVCIFWLKTIFLEEINEDKGDGHQYRMMMHSGI